MMLDWIAEHFVSLVVFVLLVGFFVGKGEKRTCGRVGCTRCAGTHGGRGMGRDINPREQGATVLHHEGLLAVPVWQCNGKRTTVLQTPSWVTRLEHNTAAILDELQQTFPLSSPLWTTNPMVDGGTWQTLFLINQGRLCHELPLLSEILKGVMGRSGFNVMCGTVFGNVFFSRLTFGEGGLCVTPHHGSTNARLRLQLPLKQPDGVTFFVAGELYSPQAGQCFLFDDSFLHSVQCNGVGGERITLIIDLWHPQLSASEIAEICIMHNV